MRAACRAGASRRPVQRAASARCRRGAQRGV